MKHDMVDMELLSKDVIDMIQSLNITGVSRVVADVFRITERESLTSPSIPWRSGCTWSSLWTEMSWSGWDCHTRLKTGSRRSGLTT